MKKLIFFIFFAPTFILSLKGQTWQWAFQGGGGSSDVGQGIAIDSKDNVLVVADYMGNINYGGQFLTGVPFSNCLVAKHDATGNLLWVSRAEYVNSKGISVDRLGNSYITGNCGFSTFFGTTNSITATQQGNGDAFIAKYDSSGNVLWVKTWGYAYSVDIANTIKTDQFGNSYIAGQSNYFNHNIGDESSNYFISKYDTQGNLLWTKTPNWQGSAAPNNLDIDAAGNCYITGVFRDTAFFDNITLLAPTCFQCNYKNHIFIVKYDKNGNVLWAKREGTDYDEGHGISLDKKGNFYLTGSHSNPSTFGLTTLNGSGTGGMFIAKYDTSGNIIWAQHGGASLGTAVKSDSSENCFVTGGFKGSAIFGSGANAVTLTSIKTNGDFFVAIYDKYGNLKWAVVPGGSNWDGNESTAINIDTQNNCFITGGFSQTTIFGNTTLNAPYATNGYADIFVAKIKEATITNITETAISPSVGELVIFPNPTIDIFSVSYITTEETGNIEVNVRNVLGQVVFKERQNNFNGKYYRTLDFGNKAKGIYFIEIVCGKSCLGKKIVVE